jgi:hypothetical protein
MPAATLSGLLAILQLAYLEHLLRLEKLKVALSFGGDLLNQK